MSGDRVESQPYRFRFVPAPDDLKPYFNSLYTWESDEEKLVDHLPAYSGQLIVVVTGEGAMKFGPKRVSRANNPFVLAPLLQAYQFQVRGPARMLGVSLNFHGWAAMTGLPVDEYHDRVLSVKDAFSEAVHRRIATLTADLRSGSVEEDAALDMLAEILRDCIAPLRDSHRQAIQETMGWLSGSMDPELSDLHRRLACSERQVQRLVTRFFGQSPVHLKRRYRAIRAATLLSMPELDPAIEAEIRNAFYDQAHLIKEIRHFTGRTPRRLQPAAGSIVTETLGADGYGAVDLFGGNESEQLGKS